MADTDPPAPLPRGGSPSSRTDGDPLVGQLVSGRYRVERLIARGGMGSIYRAEQVPLGRKVALKVLVPAMLRAEDTGELRRRFLREAETCARLRHPNTVTVYDYGTLPLPAGPGREAGEGLYIAMEFVEGRTLSRALKEDGPFSAERVARVGRQIAKSLREAHAMGVVHRDLKPGNVMLTAVRRDDGTEAVKVLDFGVAKLMGDNTDGLTMAGSFVGSPRYASPEQIQEADVDGRSDLYSLGVVMYELLAGAPPFQATDTIRMLMQHVRDTPPPLAEKVPGVSPALTNLIHALLEKRPEDRPANAEAVLDALRAAEVLRPEDQATLQSVDATTANPTSNPTPGQGGRWLVAGSLGVMGLGALVVLCGGGMWIAMGRGEEPPGALEPVVLGTPTPPPEEIPIDEERAAPRIDVELSSTPSGAEVWEGGIVIGRTPMQLEVAGGEPRDIVLHLDGYDDLTATVDGATTSMGPRLNKKPAPSKPRKPETGDDIRTSR